MSSAETPSGSDTTGMVNAILREGYLDPPMKPDEATRDAVERALAELACFAASSQSSKPMQRFY